MTNAEKYKTAEERARAWKEFCHKRHCLPCPAYKMANGNLICNFAWLDLEAEEDTLMPCPFCGSKDVSIRESINNFWFVECNVCTAKSAQNVTKENAIATYNRVAKAVADAKKEVE